MGTKRKADQAQLTAEPRRNGRNVGKYNELTSAIKTGKSKVAKKATVKQATTKSAKAKKQKVRRRVSRQTATRPALKPKSEQRELVKESVPIRTYGKSNEATKPATTNLAEKDANSNAKDASVG